MDEKSSFIEVINGDLRKSPPSLNPLSLAAIVELIARPSGGSSRMDWPYDSTDMLHRTVRPHDSPDRRYWTGYDYFIAALEHPAERRARLFRRIAFAWRRQRVRLNRVLRRGRALLVGTL
jgi:hypothetical protein